MIGTTTLPESAARPRFSVARDGLPVALLLLGLGLGLAPLYRFVGSMIWFREYLGDYQVFWRVTSLPIGQIYDHHVFAYPPTALLLMKPFGLLPFWPSLVAWSVAGALAMMTACGKIMPRKAIALGFVTYAGVGVLVGGQISLFIGALIIGGLNASRQRWRGVLLAAAAVIKPQALLAAPVALIARREWRTVGWAAGAGAGLLLLSACAFGTDVWLRWVQEVPRFHDYLVGRGIDQMDVGMYGFARSVGLPGWMFLFGVPLGMVTTWLVFRREAAPADQYAAFAASTVLMSPYTLYYDLAGLTFACVAMLLDRERSPLIWLAAALVVSSVFANIGIVLLAATLSAEAVQRSS